MSKKQAKKEKQKLKKLAEEEDRKRKNSPSNSQDAVKSKKLDRRRSLSGGFVSVETDPVHTQVTASPVSKKMLPKGTVLSHIPSNHNLSPTNIQPLASSSRNKITNENRTGL